MIRHSTRTMTRGRKEFQNRGTKEKNGRRGKRTPEHRVHVSSCGEAWLFACQRMTDGEIECDCSGVMCLLKEHEKGEQRRTKGGRKVMRLLEHLNYFGAFGALHCSARALDCTAPFRGSC